VVEHGVMPAQSKWILRVSGEAQSGVNGPVVFRRVHHVAGCPTEEDDGGAVNANRAEPQGT
jgi:hypothetical protein